VLGLGLDNRIIKHSINLPDLTKCLIVIIHLHGRVIVIAHSLLDCVEVVINPLAYSYSSVQFGDHLIDRDLVVDDLLDLTDALLEVVGLVGGSRESIDDVILGLVLDQCLHEGVHYCLIWDNRSITHQLSDTVSLFGSLQSKSNV
jgi:hypothetical protein